MYLLQFYASCVNGPDLPSPLGSLGQEQVITIFLVPNTTQIFTNKEQIIQKHFFTWTMNDWRLLKGKKYFIKNEWFHIIYLLPIITHNNRERKSLSCRDYSVSMSNNWIVIIHLIFDKT